MEHERHRAAVSKRMRVGSDPTDDERVREGTLTKLMTVGTRSSGNR